MASYSEDEVQSAVEQLVRTTISTPRGAFSERKIDATFGELREAASGVYLLYFNAPFYTLFLGATRLQDLAVSQAGLVLQIAELADALDRLVLPVEDISPLANARAALNELGSAVSARSNGFADVEQVPAWRRYTSNLDQFIEAQGPNIRDGQDVVQTPGAARAQLPGLIRTFKSSHVELVRVATSLANGLTDFDSLSLPREAANGVLSRASSVLAERFDDLSARSPIDRLELLRGVVLDLLAQRGVVKKYSSLQKPSPLHATEGNAVAYTDATLVGVNAAIDADVQGPYVIVDGADTLDMQNDGALIATPLQLPLSFVADLSNVVQGPYVIGSDSNELSISFGPAGAEVARTTTLTTGNRTAGQVAAELNATWGDTTLVANAVLTPVKLDTIMDVAGDTFTLIAGTLDGLNLLATDVLVVPSGPNAGEYGILAVDVVAGTIQVDTILTTEGGVAVQAGPAERSLQITDSDAVGSVAARRRIRIPTTGGASDAAARNLFFGPGFESRSAPTTATTLATFLTDSVSYVNGEVVDYPLATLAVARSAQENPTKVVLASHRQTGAISGSGVLTVPDGAPAGLDVGAAAVLRSSTVLADVGKQGVVTATSGTGVSIDFSGAGGVTASPSADVEFGPDLGVQHGWVVTVEDGPNAGRYIVQEVLDVPFEVTLDRALVTVTQQGSEVTFPAALGREGLRLVSPSNQLNSELRITGGSALSTFFSAAVTARGSTPHVRFDAGLPSALAVDDLFQLYFDATESNEISQQEVITAIDTDIGVITTGGQFTPTLSFTAELTTNTAPYARLRIGNVANTSVFTDGLRAWLSRATQQTDRFFRQLDALVNPLIVNKNPTRAQVNDLVTVLRQVAAQLTIESAELYGGLFTTPLSASESLEGVCASFSVQQVEPVDTLISAYLDRGADRAVDILLEGRFREFFGLAREDLTHADHLQKTVREVTRNDLPVRKTSRNDFLGSKLLATYAEADREYDYSDADQGLLPDSPGNADSF